MKIKVTRKMPVEFEVEALRLVAELRYADEDVPDGMYGLDGDSLRLQILLDGKTAKVEGWKGKPVKLHSKVCDCCSIYLVDSRCRIVAEKENDYVPNFFPGQHYGDYLILNIDKAGIITNWTATAADIQEWVEGLDKED